MDNKSKILAAGAAFLLTAGVAVASYMYRGRGAAAVAATQEETKQAPADKAAPKEQPN